MVVKRHLDRRGLSAGCTPEKVNPLGVALRGVSAMGTPLVQLSHPVRLRGTESSAA
jgi:hypothetical protein